jgi:glycosyltransferase involved in cell wall biosynthesis
VRPLGEQAGRSGGPSPRAAAPPQRLGLSVVIPVFDEEENVGLLHQALTQALAELDKSYEILYVDDGSQDKSFAALRALAHTDPHVGVIRLRRNYGQTIALAAGIDHAGGAIIVTMDADLQNDPKDIGRLLSALGEANDVVSGWRRQRRDPWVTRRLPSQIANALTRIVTGVPLHDIGCALKAYRREVLADITLVGEMHRFLPVLVAWVGGRVAEIEVAHHPRIHGVSKYGLIRTYKVIVDLVTLKFIGDFSARPNYVFGGFGLCSLLAGASSFAVVAYRVLVLRQLEATPLVFLMVVFLLTGVLSLFIGLLAEVILRGFHEVRRKPSYYIRETVGPDTTE